jgi:hypothetical protein
MYGSTIFVASLKTDKVKSCLDMPEAASYLRQMSLG